MSCLLGCLYAPPVVWRMRVGYQHVVYTLQAHCNCLVKIKDSICLLYKWAGTTFWLCKACYDRHMYRPYTRRGTTSECLIYKHKRQRRPNYVQRDFPQLMRLLPVLKPCRPNNLGWTHSGCLYWYILPLVLVSYSDPANKRHSLMLV